jgi:uncharacterized peroxidase-related enzyme
MSQFTIHTVDSAPAASRETLAAAQKKFGFLPNLLGELAAAPAALQAYVTLNELLGRTSLSPVAQQVVLVAVSMANGCHYCVAAHTAGLKMAGFAEDEIDALRAGRSLADLKLEALRVFTIGVVEQRGWIDDTNLQRFLDAGYAREQVFEVLVGVAMKTLSNYSNHIAETPLDKQLQPLAWEPAAVVTTV